MNKRAWAYLGLLVASAGAAFAVVPHAALSVRELIGFVTFIGLGVLAEGLALDFQIGSAKQTRSSVAYLPLFSCALLFPPFWTMLGGAAMIAGSDIFLNKRRNWVPVFNAAQYSLALAAATFAFRASGGTHTGMAKLSLVAFFSMAVTYFACNLAIIAAFFSLRSGKNVFSLAREIIGPTGSNLFYDVLASPLAVLSAGLYQGMYVWGLVLTVLPLLLVRYSYLSARQLRQSNRDLIRVLIKAIETRDPYTSGHSVRVSALAGVIAKDLGLPRRKAEFIETAGLFHDIGKIESLYASIIGKPHELTPGERAIIRTHPTKGADMLRGLSAFQDEEVIAGVRHHHERFDGAGYPDGLSGTTIPIGARVIMICDALDAMLSDRPYRRALDLESVRRELVRCAGSQFDPEIVRMVLARGTVELAYDLVQREPPDAMAHPALVSVAAGK